MNEMSALPSEVAEWLAGRENLSGMIFLTEFPPVKKAVPLKKTTVAVGISSIRINDMFEENGEEIPEEREYCRSAEIELKFSIHVPYSEGGAACHGAFADIIDCLTFDSGLNIISSGCEDISEDRQTDALVLKAKATVKADLCPAQSPSEQFPSFLDKTLFCGSHIRDTDIHLSRAQKDFLDEPFITGTYMGNGNYSRSISVGFRPGVVLAAAGEMPAMKIDTPNRMQWAFAFGSTGTMGISIGSDGFTVNEGGSDIFGAVPGMNAAGVVYNYMAFR